MRNYPYATNRQLMTGGIPWTLDSTVPEQVRIANEAIGLAKRAEHDADVEVGKLTLATEAAALADREAYGRALADGLPDPGNAAVTKHKAKLDAAKRVADATRVATLVCENRLIEALQSARDSGTLAAAVKALDDRVTEGLAAANEHLGQASTRRSEALIDRAISRYLDAWPQSANDFNYTPVIGDGDSWTHGLSGIREDLRTIGESKPISLLLEEQREGRRTMSDRAKSVTPSEGRF